jgi:hypothetical protein
MKSKYGPPQYGHPFAGSAVWGDKLVTHYVVEAPPQHTLCSQPEPREPEVCPYTVDPSVLAELSDAKTKHEKLVGAVGVLEKQKEELSLQHAQSVKTFSTKVSKLETDTERLEGELQQARDREVAAKKALEQAEKAEQLRAQQAKAVPPPPPPSTCSTTDGQTLSAEPSHYAAALKAYGPTAGAAALLIAVPALWCGRRRYVRRAAKRTAPAAVAAAGADIAPAAAAAAAAAGADADAQRGGLQALLDERDALAEQLAVRGAAIDALQQEVAALKQQQTQQDAELAELTAAAQHSGAEAERVQTERDAAVAAAEQAEQQIAQLQQERTDLLERVVEVRAHTSFSNFV